MNLHLKAKSEQVNSMNSRGRIRLCNKEDRKGSLNANQVLRRLSVLCEGRQFVEAAHLVNRLGPTSLQWIVAEMPLDLLAEALPHSAPLLENLFSRLCTTTPNEKDGSSSSSNNNNVGVDRIIWHLVKLFGNPFDYNLVQRCDQLVKFIGNYQPDLKSQLINKSSSFESAIQGLGMHGLTHITNSHGGFQSLYSALRRELQSHIEAYKLAISMIDESDDSDPAHASHQRLLAYKYDDVQQRLIHNKTLLTKLEQPGLRQLDGLVGHLRQRVERDKEVLFSVNEIKKLDRDVDLKEWPAAKIIMDFTKGCKTVVSLMERREPTIADDAGSSGSEGYHSEPEADEAKLLAEEYYNLYKSSRVETLKALNENHQFEIAESVKLKILFSVVVLAFRSCHNLRERKLLEVRRTLNAFDQTAADAINQLESAVKNYLTTNCDNFPLDDVEKTVVNQIYSTLHDYACIRQLLEVLMAYIKKCVRLAWKLCNQSKICHLDNDFTLSKINPKKHTRASMSCQKSTVIQYFLWPALFQSGECISKAIVVT